jgi:hypothetical protein
LTAANNDLDRLASIESDYDKKCKALSISLGKQNDLEKQKCHQANVIMQLNLKIDNVSYFKCFKTKRIKL